MLSDRHPHAGELQPLAHDLQRPQPPSVRRKTVDTPVGRRRHLQRLSALRLADDRHLDGERSFRLAPTGNRLYDLFYRAGVPLDSQRVASPFISPAIASLHLYKAIDPDTWGRMVGRVDGANFAALYGRTAAAGWQSARLPKGMTWELHALPALDPSGADAAQLSGKTIRKHPLLARKGGCLSEETIAKLQRPASASK